jgi:DNA-binding GntR family transcriptional regulator
MELVGPSTVVQAAAAALREQLLGGRLPAGHVLRDTALADELGIARPTLRAAVQQLVADGLLERDRGRSARVPVFSTSDLADLYGARTVVELAAIDRVEADPSQLGLVTTAMQNFEAVDRSSWRLVVEADVSFHRSIVQAARSPRLLAMFDGLANETRLAIALQRSLYEDADELVAEHRTIVNALRRKAFDSARKHLRAHFEQTIEWLQTSATSATARTS